MDVSFGEVRAIDAGVWAGTLSATDAKRLPGAPLKIAGPHVVLVQRPVWDGVALKAPFASVSVLALGHGEVAIYLSAEAGARRAAADAVAAAPVDAPATTASAIAPGETPAHALTPRRRGDTGDDETFIYAAEELGADMMQVARAFMARVRATNDGALRYASGRQYVETPDNFWSVEVQPRCRAIKLVVRTTEEKLLRADLPYVSERPPSYFAMKIYGDGDIDTALKFLAQARDNRCNLL